MTDDEKGTDEITETKEETPNESITAQLAKRDPARDENSWTPKGFTIDPESGEVVGYRNISQAQAIANATGGGLLAVRNEKDLKTVPMAALLLIYNRAIDETPEGEPRPKHVTRFSDSETAARRVWPVIEYLGEEHRGKYDAEKVSAASESNSTDEGDDMAAKKKGARKGSARKSGGARKSSGTRRKLVNMIIRKNKVEDWGRPDSKRTKLFKALRDGTTVAKFYEMGGSPTDLKTFLDKKAIKLEKGKED